MLLCLHQQQHRRGHSFQTCSMILLLDGEKSCVKIDYNKRPEMLLICWLCSHWGFVILVKKKSCKRVKYEDLLYRKSLLDILSTSIAWIICCKTSLLLMACLLISCLSYLIQTTPAMTRSSAERRNSWCHNLHCCKYLLWWRENSQSDTACHPWH